MGYTTDFWGDGFTITPEPSEDIVALINGLASTRRMKRDMSKLFPGEDVSIYGTEGEFYYNPETTNFGQEEDVSILEFNYPPRMPKSPKRGIERVSCIPPLMKATSN